MPAISVKSPGKTILFGEHAVVYGHPAIAVPLNSIRLRVGLIGLPNQPQGRIIIHNHDTGQIDDLSTLEKDHPIKAAIRITANALKLKHLPATELNISSSIPIASGLGSSAALASAIIRGFSQYLGFNLSNQEINDLAFEIEKIQHGTPSGIDNSVITYNKPVYFIKDQPIKFLQFKDPVHLVIANTGIHSLTKEVVTEVRVKLEQQPENFSSLLDQIGSIAKTAKENLIKGDLEDTGQLMSENHNLLVQLGVSCPELDMLVDTAMNQGALGAKLCGSGKGGNMIALVEAQQSDKIKEALLSKGAVSALSAKVG